MNRKSQLFRPLNYHGRSAEQRSGAILIKSALMLPVILVFCSFIVDLGYILVVNAELQNSADSAALAAANQVLDDRVVFIRNNPTFFQKNPITGEVIYGTLPSDFYNNARQTAATFANLNKAGRVAVAIDPNTNNSASGDLVFGRYVGPNQPLDLTNPIMYNAVQVKVRRDDQLNGSFNLFFAKLIGLETHSSTATAQASFMDAITGFSTPPDGQNSSILPFAISRTAWEALIAKWKLGTGGQDSYSADPDSAGSDSISNGGDGIPEINLLGGGTSGNVVGGVGHVQITPGNWGTVNIGTSNNSTSHLRDVIRNGPSANDFDFHGGQLSVDDGPFQFSGDPGMPTGADAALQAIIGQRRTILIYDQVTGNGNNTSFRIVDFAPIRLLNVQLQGNSKGITVQPDFVNDGGAQGGGSNPNYSLTAPPGLTL